MPTIIIVLQTSRVLRALDVGAGAPELEQLRAELQAWFDARLWSLEHDGPRLGEPRRQAKVRELRAGAVGSLRWDIRGPADHGCEATGWILPGETRLVEDDARVRRLPACSRPSRGGKTAAWWRRRSPRSSSACRMRDKGEIYLMKKRTIAALVVLAFLVPACGSGGEPPEAPPDAAAADFYTHDPFFIASGLVMQFGFSPAWQSQAESIAYCASLPLAGGGWRLPTKDELLIVYANRFALEPTDEPFWSSSSDAGSPSYGWDVNFSSGVAYNVGATNTFRARCVR